MTTIKQRYSTRTGPWEYYPMWFIYFPLYIWYIGQSIRFRSRGWIMASNPGLANAGLVGEDKRTALSQLHDTIKPKTLFRDHDEGVLSIDEKIIQSGIGYPCIAKADISRRSQKVAIIHNTQDLQEITNKGRGNIIIQEYIQNQQEFGISYARIPGQKSGNIIGIIHKSFAYVCGDGIQTLQQLITDHTRYHRYIDIIQAQNLLQRDTTIPHGETINIMPFGAHSRGTIFEDWSDQTTQQINDQIDHAAQQVSGFYVGRFDIKAESLDHIARGEYKIIELNGVGGIPAHMYDPHYNIWQGWKTLFQYRDNVAQVVEQSIKLHDNIILPNARQMYTIIQ